MGRSITLTVIVGLLHFVACEEKAAPVGAAVALEAAAVAPVAAAVAPVAAAVARDQAVINKTDNAAAVKDTSPEPHTHAVSVENSEVRTPARTTEEDDGEWMCEWMAGDGDGKGEKWIGKQTGQQCIDDCVQRYKDTDRTINGITTKQSGDGCWCESVQNNVKTSTYYKTCYLQRPGYIADSYRCKTEPGDASSTKYETITPWVSAQDCVDKCADAKGENDAINGVTIITGSNPTCRCHTGMTLLKTTSDNNYKSCLLVPLRRYGHGDHVCQWQSGTLGGSGGSTKQNANDYQGCFSYCINNHQTNLRGISMKYDGTQCHCLTDSITSLTYSQTPNVWCIPYSPESISSYKNIATGTNYNTPPSLKYQRISDCKRIYTARGDPVDLSSQINDDIDIETVSRGFIKVNKVQIKSSAVGGTTPSFTWSACKNSQNSRGYDFKGEKMTVKETYQVLPWLRLRKNVQISVEFDWRKILLKGGKVWNAMKLHGIGQATIGTGGTTAACNIKFTKEMQDDTNTLVDADVNLKIEDRPNKKWKLMKFLILFEKNLAALYRPQTMVHIGSLNRLSFKKKPGETHLFNAEISMDGEYNIHVIGAASGCPFVQALNDWTVMCQQEKTGEPVKCALIGKVDPADASKKRNVITTLVTGKNWHTDVGTYVRFFRNNQGVGNKWPGEMLFQTSRNTIPSILSEDLSETVKGLTYNEQQSRVTNDESEETAIYPDMCFRFKMSVNQLGWPQSYRNKYILVSMCAEPGKYMFYLPDIGPVQLLEIPTMLFFHGRPSLAGLESIPDQTMDFVSLEFSGHYDHIITLKPRVISAQGPDGPDGFKFSSKYKFFLIRENEIILNVGAQQTTIFAEGSEEFLGKKAKYRIMSDNVNGATIEYTDMKFENSYFLIKSLNAELDIVPDEFTKGAKDEFGEDTFTFTSPYNAMGKVVLSNLKLNPVGPTEVDLKFIADSPLPSVSNAKYQLNLWPDPEDVTKYKARTCRFADGEGRMSDFINDIQDKTFFEMSWLGYDSIAIIHAAYFPEDMPDRAKCHADLCCLLQVTVQVTRSFKKREANEDEEDMQKKTEKLEKPEKRGRNDPAVLSRNQRFRFTFQPFQEEKLGTHWIKMTGLRLHSSVCRDPVTNNVRPPCTFLRRLFKMRQEEDVIKVNMYGHMDQDELWVRGKEPLPDYVYMSAEVVLMDPTIDIKVRTGSGADPNVVGKRTEFIIESYTMMILRNTIIAAVKCSLSEESVAIQITEVRLDASLTESYFSFSGESQYSMNLDPEADLTILETKLPLTVSYTGRNGARIEFNDAERNVGLLDPKKKKFVRMIACRDEDMHFSDLMPALNGNNFKGFDDIKVTDLCVYFNMLGPWEWEEAGLTIPTGLTLNGGAETMFQSYISDPKKAVSLTLHMTHPIEEPDERELCITLPPQRWGNMIGYPTEVDKAILEIFETKKDPNSVQQSVIGPDYCYILPKSNNNNAVKGKLKGYVKSFIYEGNLEIDIGPPANARGRVTELRQFTYKTKENELVSLFGGAMGKFELTGDLMRDNFNRPWMIDWAVTVEINSLKPGSFVKGKTRFLGPLRAIKTIVRKWSDELMDLVHGNDRRDSIENDTSHETKYKATKMELQRSINSFSKDCDEECGFARFPGWNVDNVCGKSSTGLPLKCLNYAKDSNIAKDVGCVALCETERVKSFADAKDLHKEAKDVGVLAQRRENCQQAINDIGWFSLPTGRYINGLAQLKSKKTLDYDVNAWLKADAFQIFKFKSVNRFQDFTDPNCLNFEVEMKLGQKQRIRSSSMRICGGKFSQDVYIAALKHNWGEEMTEVEEKLKSIQNTAIVDHEINMDKIRAYAREAAAKCKNRDKITASERSEIEQDLPDFRPVEYTLFGPSTMESFSQSPWEVVQEQDALKNLQLSKRSKLQQNLTISEKDHPCTVAKRAATDYSDITTYISKWIKNHEAAKKTLAESKDFVTKSLQRTNATITTFSTVRNYTQEDSENLAYWMDRTKSGIEQWMSTEDERIKRYNVESIPFIHKELEFVYTDDKYKTLAEFFAHRGVDGTNAFKKANIATPSQNTFSELSKTLLDVLQNSKSLEEASAPINEAVKQVERLSKRSIICI